MLKKIVLGSLLGLTFVYCIIMGIYKIFPFYEIKSAIDFVSGQEESNSFKSPYYLHKTSFFKLNSQSNYDVVFVGDSITDGSDWYDIFPDITVANRGIGGDTTAGVLNRMDTIISTNAEKAFLMIGINDIGSGIDIDTTFNNYVQIIVKLQKSNIQPFVQSTLLANVVTIDNKYVNELNTRLKAFCEQNNIIFIDLNPLLSKSGKLNENYSIDGLHINGQGYVIWSKALLNYIK